MDGTGAKGDNIFAAVDFRGQFQPGLHPHGYAAVRPHAAAGNQYRIIQFVHTIITLPQPVKDFNHEGHKAPLRGGSISFSLLIFFIFFFSSALLLFFTSIFSSSCPND
jgi:hypothetical protein